MPGNVEDIYELSPLQQGLLLHSVHDGASDMYLSQHTYSVDGPLDIDVLVTAWQRVVAGHPALRTSFHWQGVDKPLQVVHRDVTLPVTHHDWSDTDDADVRDRLERLWVADREQGLDLTTAPLQRLAVIRRGPERHDLAWTYHHLLMDGWSIPIFLGEVMAHYGALLGGPPAPPAAPPFRAYVGWLQQQDRGAAQRFWTEALAGVRPTRLTSILPGDPTHATGAVDRCTVRLPAGLAERLRDAAARHGVTFGTVVQAAWAITLRHHTPSTDIVFGSATSGRPPELPGVDRMVGLFANTLPARVTVPEDGDLGAWLRDIQDTQARTRRFDHTPLADVKRWAGLPGQQLFESLLVLENYSLEVDLGGATGGTGARALSFRTHKLYDKIDIPLTLTVAPGLQAELHLLVHADRFAPGFVEEILACLDATFAALLDAERIGPVVAAGGPVPDVVATADRARPGDTGPVAPATPLEERIAAAFRDVLELPDVDVTANFFELGGDSFGVVRAVSRIEGATVGMLAAHPTVRALAEALSELRAAPITPVPRTATLDCTHQQEGLWFMDRLAPGSSVYHIPFALRLHGDLDVPALRRSLRGLVARHEALRTRFVEEAGVPRQVIDPAPDTVALEVADLDAADVERWASGEITRPLDLSAGPLLRTSLARLGPREHALVLVVHHIVADGWSAGILAAELSARYTAETGGAPAELPELAIQPADHAAWQRTHLDGAELDRMLDHWRTTLADLPTVAMPTDRSAPARPTGAGAAVVRVLPDQLVGAAREYARAHRVSFLAVLQAALLTVLNRYTGQTDLPIGSIVTGRTRAELAPLVGFFANTVVLRTDVSGDPSFGELIGRCHDVVTDATAHQEVPFGLVVDAVGPERVPGRNPLFQISLTSQPAGTNAGGLALGDVAVDQLEVSEGSARFAIEITATDLPDGGLAYTTEYATELFDADRIERLVDHCTAALTAGLADPGVAVTDVELLSAAEREQVLRRWNATATNLPEVVPHHRVEQTVARTPDTLALVDHDGTAWTYRELDAAANRLAHLLHGCGVGPEVPVGVCLPRGRDLVVTLLAVWKAGGGYVPLDPELPVARLAATHADAAPAVVVTDGPSTPRLAGTGATLLDLDAERTALAAAPATTPGVASGIDDLAYVLYTSGSTGVPKGVRVPRRVVHRQVSWLQAQYPLTAADRVVQKTPYGFDVSVWEFFWPLTVGATLVLAAPGGHRDPAYLHRTVAERGITTMHFVPTMFEAFLDTEAAVDVADGPVPLRQVFCSGEELRPAAARRFLARWPGVALHNLYGPTEAFDVTAWPCAPGADVVPIGAPIADMRAYVLDARLRPLPVGVPGPLFVAGAGLAHGYLGRPGLTAERFVPEPFADRPGERMYATGDIARWRADGTLEYLGRGDRQVKIGGVRVELGEIEHALADHPRIRRSAVLPRADQLVAYVVGTPAPSLADVRDHLADRLPSVMIPTRVVAVAELPVNANGKLDAARLPDPPAAMAEYVPPRTATERALATIWQDLLDVARVSADDDFFALGGNSLHATRLTARVASVLGRSLAVRTLFTDPVLADLAARLDRSETAEAAPIPVLPRPEGMAPTHQQEGLWFLHRLNPASSTYHLAFALALHGELDVAALSRAVTTLVARHEALRTRFVDHAGLPQQLIEPAPAEVPVPVDDLEGADVEGWVAGQIHRPLDPVAGPVFRIGVSRCSPTEHALVMMVHHIVADGWSVRILAEELTALYRAETGGPPAALPAPPIQPADHAVWQRARFDGAALDRGLNHWRATLADLPVIDLPTDRPRPASPTGAGASLTRPLPAEVGAAVRAYATAEHVSFLAVLQAALATVLHRYTGQTDLPIGSVFAGRDRAELERVVGFFATTVVLRTDVGGDPTFADLVRRCHETVLDATAHQDVPFGLVVDALAPERVAGRNPLFQVSLSLQPAGTAADLRLGAASAEPIDLRGGSARFDLALDVVEDGDGTLGLTVEYSTELFDTDRVERLADHVAAALAGGLDAPDAPADDIELMSAAEREQVLPTWNPAPEGPSR